MSCNLLNKLRRIDRYIVRQYYFALQIPDSTVILSFCSRPVSQINTRTTTQIRRFGTACITFRVVALTELATAAGRCSAPRSCLFKMPGQLLAGTVLLAAAYLQYWVSCWQVQCSPQLLSYNAWLVADHRQPKMALARILTFILISIRFLVCESLTIKWIWRSRNKCSYNVHAHTLYTVYICICSWTHGGGLCVQNFISVPVMQLNCLKPASVTNISDQHQWPASVASISDLHH